MPDTFTKAEMEAAYAEHGDRLAYLDGDGEGPFSANPADYFWAGPTDEFQGTLVVRTPESYAPVEA